MTWNWESFPEYLDELERLPRTVDVGTHVPHGAVRAYVMDERGAQNDTPTEHEIARMSQIVEEAIRAGALGFSTSRTILHRSINGELVPGTTATKEELIGIGRGMGRVGYGVFEMTYDLKREWNEFEWMGELSRETGLPVTFAALQSIAKELPLEEQISEMRAQNAKGANIVAQIVAARERHHHGMARDGAPVPLPPGMAGNCRSALGSATRAPEGPGVQAADDHRGQCVSGERSDRSHPHRRRRMVSPIPDGARFQLRAYAGRHDRGALPGPSASASRAAPARAGAPGARR